MRSAAEVAQWRGYVMDSVDRYKEELDELSASDLDRAFIIFMNLGRLHRILHEGEKALSCYHNCVRLDPTNEAAHIFEGEVLCELERYPEAMAHYDEMALLFPASRAEIAAARQAAFSMMEQSVAKRLRVYSDELTANDMSPVSTRGLDVDAEFRSSDDLDEQPVTSNGCFSFLRIFCSKPNKQHHIACGVGI